MGIQFINQTVSYKEVNTQFCFFLLNRLYHLNLATYNLNLTVFIDIPYTYLLYTCVRQ